MDKNHALEWVRTRAGMSQQQAADKIGVTRFTFCRWETGKKAMPAKKWHQFLSAVDMLEADIPARNCAPAVSPSAVTEDDEDDEGNQPYYDIDGIGRDERYWYTNVSGDAPFRTREEAVGFLRVRRAILCARENGLHSAFFAAGLNSVWVGGRSLTFMEAADRAEKWLAERLGADLC